MNKLSEQVENLLRAGYVSIAITTSEQDRVRKAITTVVEKLKEKTPYDFIWYEPVVGTTAPLGGNNIDAGSLGEVLTAIHSNVKTNGVYVICDAQLELGGLEHEPVERELLSLTKATIRKCRFDAGKGKIPVSKHIIFVGVRHTVATRTGA
jgi:hypothetical protein